MRNSNSLTDIPGILVGHASDQDALTGCTVILTEAGATAGVDQRGGAPGTRETDLLRPSHLVNEIHAVILSGGSAFGLDAASGVMRYLEQRGVGFETGAAKVPIVPEAVLFDLMIGRPDIRPDAEMGYTACRNAGDQPVEEGNVGAGTGATVGKILGMPNAMKSGIGSSSIHLSGGIIIAALVAVNALGDIIDPKTGLIIAGARQQASDTDSGNSFANTLEIMKEMSQRPGFQSKPPSGNTVIGVVATNAKFSKEQITKVSQMAQDGLARAVRPAHTMVDGDTIFGLSIGEKQADINLVGALAAELVSEAIIRAVKAAQPAGGLPSASSLPFRTVF